MKHNIYKFLSLAFMFMACVTFVGTTAYAEDYPANPTTKEGYTLDFQEEFNEPTLDTTKWTDYYLPHWCENPSTAKANYRIEDGCLVEYITEDQEAWCPAHDGTVKSSAIMSFDKSWIHNFSGTSDNHDRETWYGYKTTYGYIELRAKLANCGGGGHQAWWLVGMQQDTDDWFNSKQTGEIDILETFFSRSNNWRIAAYGWNDPNFLNYWQITDSALPSGDPSNEFHIYAVDWTPDSLKFYYDNELYYTIEGAPDYDMGMILNIYTDAGSGEHNDVWPKEWAVDYIRVWKSNEGYQKVTKEYNIQNRQTGHYMYIDPDSNAVKYGPLTDENAAYAKWEKVKRGDYVLLKNCKTGEYLHIENLTGYVEHGEVPTTWWSAQWTESEVDGYTRLINRWQPDYSIHTEDYQWLIQYGNVPTTYWTSQWRFIPVS